MTDKHDKHDKLVEMALDAGFHAGKTISGQRYAYDGAGIDVTKELAAFAAAHVASLCADRASSGAAQAVRPDPKNCTASVGCTNGRITTKSCVTGKPLIDKGGSSDGERDYYECPDCGKDITIDYREN